MLFIAIDFHKHQIIHPRGIIKSCKTAVAGGFRLPTYLWVTTVRFGSIIVT